MNLAPSLRQRLTRAKLLAPGIPATHGIGERPSKQRGDGIEFEEHRLFRSGDDARRIDPHVYARTGVPHVREYNVGRQLTVTLLLDGSRSMAFGAPSKYDVARTVATGLAFVGLAGADAVQTGVWCRDRLHWRPRCSGLHRAEELDRWWGGFEPSGGSDLGKAIRRLRPELPSRGLAVVIGDLWMTEVAEAVESLSAAGQGVVVVQVLSPEEVHPERVGRGSVRMLDAEDGPDVAVDLDDAAFDRYRSLLGAWTDDLRRRVAAGAGRFARVTTDATAEDVFLRTLPAAGILR